MRRIVSLAGFILLITGRAALAYGVNISWNECLPEGGAHYKFFACDTNLALHTAVGSFAVPLDLPDFIGLEAIVDLQAAAAALPDWWQFWNAGSCRQNSLSVSADFTLSPQTACTDPFSGLAAGGIAAYQTAAYPPPPPLPPIDVRQARLKMAFAVATPVPITAETEYYGFALRINSAKTTGSGACAGCDVPLCIGLTTIRAWAQSGEVYSLTFWMQDGYISWQCGVLSPRTGCEALPGAPPCATPVQNRTWGGLKSLYR